ncbi:MAG: alpha/beta hydrolase [Candidatus Krumholzibacteria bacterium]|nr:alpha/beta hydrolase [Candidatus Krumholzibacteria bacterium]
MARGSSSESAMTVRRRIGGTQSPLTGWIGLAARVSVVLIAATLSSCVAGRPRSMLIGLTQISYVTMGEWEPAVVLEAGMGNGLESWKPIFEEVAAATTTLAYSRPGYAGKAFYKRQSDGKRTADDVARMLKKVLDKSGLPPPYVLVGHSIGGTYVLRFAMLYPDYVAGIVLVDARLKGFTEKCEAAGFKLCTPPWVAGLLMPDHVREELDGLEESEAESPTADELGNIPVTVIAATKPPVYAPDELQELWLSVQSEFASALSNGRYVRAAGCGHYVHRDDPELVIGEIRDLVVRVRGGE